MKNIYLIGGTMGAGKTTISRILQKQLANCVFLDGDWCWDACPFQVTDEIKRMVIDNICHLLGNFINCSAYENIIFCWVMHEQAIIDDILSRLDTRGCAVRCISLVCDESALTERLRRDIDAGLRQPDVIARSLARLPLYSELNTVKVDVSDISPENAAEIILKI